MAKEYQTDGELYDESLTRKTGGEAIELNENQAAELILEVEEVFDAIKNGEMEGDYFEF